tara:strand:+ start:532 stop:1023 length:492 start_codon:yes stop_codon:yes gene_type:complete
MINFQKAFKFGRPFFESVGRTVLRLHKRRIFNEGRNPAMKPFPAYTEAYKKRKMAGKAAKNQVSRSGKPDLTLTGRMKKAFNYIKSSSHGFEYGISDSAMADRMRFQGPEKKKKIKQRFVSTKKDPLPINEQKLIAREMQNELMKNFTKELRKNNMGYKVYTL